MAAAAAAGIDALDTPYGDIEDLEGLRAESRRARSFGFAGKCAIHPDQVSVIREVFAPTPTERQRAERIAAAAAEQGTGAIRVDGRMVDQAMVRWARRILADAPGSEPKTVGEGANSDE